MANEYFHIYGGNPTAGATDGTLISEGTELAPLTISLDATAQESKKIKLAIRTEPGYEAAEGTVITSTIIGGTGNSSLWSFCETENGTYADAVTLAGGLDSVNTIFYTQASSSSLESPSRDTSVDITANPKIILSD